jgi:hypothetical protein
MSAFDEIVRSPPIASQLEEAGADERRETLILRAMTLTDALGIGTPDAVSRAKSEALSLLESLQEVRVFCCDPSQLVLNHREHVVVGCFGSRFNITSDRYLCHASVGRG